MKIGEKEFTTRTCPSCNKTINELSYEIKSWETGTLTHKDGVSPENSSHLDLVYYDSGWEDNGAVNFYCEHCYEILFNDIDEAKQFISLPERS